jgi:hypothetical protein
MKRVFAILISDEQRADVERLARENSMLPSTFVRRVLRDAVQRHVTVAGIDDNFRKYGSVKKSTRKAAPEVNASAAA